MQDNNKIPKTHKFGLARIGNQFLKADKCVHSLLGNTIDIKWHIANAQIELSSSQQKGYSHEKHEGYEVFKGVPFFHEEEGCELLDENIIKNQGSYVVPCAVVFIKDHQTSRVLATRRHEKMSFGNLWVLPGGHLERGESIIQGGLRECEEQVGLSRERVKLRQNPEMMVWQSVLTDQANQRIKRVALVVFFSIEAESFEVKGQASEVKEWQWREFEGGVRPWGGGWAAGHLRYLDYLNQQKSK